MTEIDVGELKMIPFEDIEIGERTREEMGDLNGMETSMKERGLISPLAVKQLPNNKYLLLAGERRYLVLKKNSIESIPVRVYDSDISDHEIRSIELAENFFRKDFEYWEYDNLVREVHKLQQEIHGTKAPGPDGSGWGTEDTGKMMGASKATVSTAISRANARDAFPGLFDKAKTQADASKLLKKMDESIVKDAIARKIQAERTDSTFTQLAKCYVLGNFFEMVKEIPDKVMHLVEIDSPYAINLDGSDKGSSAKKDYAYGDSYNEIDSSTFIDGDPDPDEPWRGINSLYKECYRVMTENSWMLVWFAPQPWFEYIYKAIIEAGFDTTRMCGIWTKPSGQSKRPEIHLANSYEMFFYAWKGRPALNKPGRSNNFVYSPVPPQQKTHPTERPIELMRDIYETFAFPGSRVLIPFLGSGVSIIAANDLGMSPIGFDLGKGYKDSFLVKLHGLKEI